MNETRTRTIRLPAPTSGAAAHEIVCASRSALAAVYDEVADATWVEACAVDLPNLRLVVRVADAGHRTSLLDPTQGWLERVQRIASGR